VDLITVRAHPSIASLNKIAWKIPKPLRVHFTIRVSIIERHGNTPTLFLIRYLSQICFGLLTGNLEYGKPVDESIKAEESR
jgi:hypothetical protein